MLCLPPPETHKTHKHNTRTQHTNTVHTNAQHAHPTQQRSHHPYEHSNVSTDDYLTLSILGGSGTKEWFLAPPEATDDLRRSARFAKGRPSHTSGFKPSRAFASSTSTTTSAAAATSSSSSSSSSSLTLQEEEEEACEEEKAAKQWFHRVTVSRGDLLLVPPKWWHEVVTKGQTFSDGGNFHFTGTVCLLLSNHVFTYTTASVK